MVSTQGEIRVGPSHQARLPDYRPGLSDVDIPPDPEFTKDREEIKWVPAQALDGDLLMFLRAARSMAAFAGMCDGASADDGTIAASKDDTTINALDALHASGYDPGKALQALVKCPVPKALAKKWSEEEVKRFVKGLRQFGKNFFRIRKDLLPHKDTPELVEFYYLWKKTPGANNNRPHRRNRRQGSLRRIRNTRNSRGQPKEEKEGQANARPSPNPKEGGEGSSGSEEDNSEDDSDSRDQTYRCNHCFAANSRDLQQYGKDRQMLCGDCRAHHKKHGELPPVPVGTGKPGEAYLFRPVQTESPDSSPGRMRTRGKTKEQSTPGSRSRPKRGNGTSTPDSELEKDKKQPKSPGDKKAKSSNKDTPTKNRKRNQSDPDERNGEDTPTKKKKSAEDLECNDESNDNFEEKTTKVEETIPKQEPVESRLETVVIKSEAVIPEDKPLEVDPLKIAPLPLSPITLMVANNDRQEIIPKQEEPAPEPEEPPQPEPPEEIEKVLTIDPKTGLIGPEALPAPLPVNTAPTKVIIEDPVVPVEVPVPSVIQSAPVPPPPVIAPKPMSIIVPQPGFLNQSTTSPILRPTPKPIITEPVTIKLEPKDEEPKPPEKVEPDPDKPCNFSVAKLHETEKPVQDGEPPPPPVVKEPVQEPPILMPVPPQRDIKEPMHQGLLMPPHLSLPHYPYPFTPHSRGGMPYGSEQPQNLKIKQEVQIGEMFDPLQNLKDLKVPGQNDRLPGPSIDNIKKEPEPKMSPLEPAPSTRPRSVDREKEREFTPSERDIKPPPPEEESHTPPLPPRPRSSSRPTPPTSGLTGSSSPFVAISAPSLLPSSSSASPVPSRPSSSHKSRDSHHPPSLVSPSAHLPGSSHLIQPPTSIPGPLMHPSQQPSPLNRISPAHHPAVFLPPHMAPHHPVVQHSLPLFAAMHSPYHPYAAYPFGYPYPYPIPPPQMKETTMTHHSSSSVTTRVRETDRIDDIGEGGSTETTTLHHSSVHHSHSSSDKQQGIHISHSTSSSSTASVKKQSSTARVSSPVAHMSATMSQTQSTSISLGGNSQHHSHHHTHHHQSGDVVLGSSQGRVKTPHHGMMAIPPIHSMGLPPQTVPGSSLEALRAHAVAAASMQQAPAHSSHHPSRHSSVEELKSEPPPEPIEITPDEDDGSPPHAVRGPSPEPKIEDSECHRSQSAIFLRHWNRGDYNSCARTDLTFKPVPESKLARKREERLRKMAEREREEREKAAQQAQTQRKVASTPENKESTSKPPSRGPIETISSPYDRFAQRAAYPDTPALRQLSEYARPHAGFSPGRAASIGIPQCLDSMLQYQFNSMYGPRDRMELEHLEREKREREMRELRERELNDRLKEELMKSAGAPIGARMATPLDPHWLELHRRYGGHPAQFGLYPSPGHPGPAGLSPLERERLERLGIPPGAPTAPQGPGSSSQPHPHPSSVAALEAAERLALATDPMVRLQMAGISPEYHAHTHAHTHAHSHTHLHLHPSQQAQAQQEAAAAAAGFPLPPSAPPGYPRPSLLPSRDMALGLHHPADLLGRPYADQLAQQAAAHEQLQRQMLLERERFPHPSLVAHDEYIRAQRERELKVRALEEAARGTRS